MIQKAKEKFPMWFGPVATLFAIALAFLSALEPSVARVLLIVTPLAILSYMYPFLGLALNYSGAYIFTHFFAISEVESGLLLAMRFILVLSLIKLSREGQLTSPKVHNSKYLFVLSAFFLMIFGVLYSDSVGYGFIKALRFLSFNTVLFILPLFVKWTKDNFVSFLKALAVVGALGGWLSIFFVMYNGLDLSDRVSIMADVNVIWVSRAMGVSVLAILGLFLLKVKDQSMLFLVVSLPGLLAAMLLSGSRGPILSLIIALVVILVFQTRRKKQTIVLLMIGFLLSIFSLMIVMYLSSSSIRLLTDPTNLGNDISALHRVIAWLKSIEVIRTNMFLGIGTGGFQAIGNELFPWLPKNIYAYPHNLFIEVMLEHGAIGMFIFFWPLAKIIFIESQLNQLEDYRIQAVLLGFIAFALINAQVGGDITMNESLWYAVGLLAAVSASDLEMGESEPSGGKTLSVSTKSNHTHGE